MFAINAGLSRVLRVAHRSTPSNFATTKYACQRLVFDVVGKRTLFVGCRQPVFRSTLLFSGKLISRSLKGSAILQKSRWQTLKDNNPRWFLTTWPKLRLLFRFTRVSILLVMFGGLCTTLGRITLLDNPEEYYEATLRELLFDGYINKFVIVHENLPLAAEAKKLGSPFVNKYDDEGEVHTHATGSDDPVWRYAQITQRVFVNIKKGAIIFSEDMRRLLLEEFDEIPKDNMTKADIKELRSEMLGDVTTRLQKLKQPWTVVVTDDPVPNAFVIGLLPRYVFVTKGLFEEFAHNEHELAMVLGHELSHYLLGHTRDGVAEMALFKGLVIAALSVVDISGGLGSLALELLLPVLGDGLEKKYSRDHENEADACGIAIVASSCYDPDQAVHMFERMRAFEKSMGGGNGLRMLCTHPDPGGRLKTVTGLVDDVMDLLGHNNCYTTEVQVGDFVSTMKEALGAEKIEKEVKVLKLEVWDWGHKNATHPHTVDIKKEGRWVKADDGQGQPYWWHTKTRETTRSPQT
eukprot:m.74486 g.74486  ORF g.74486 m.74486 type:complete len:520 (+) comp24663_c0_seq1:265-1824(+)